MNTEQQLRASLTLVRQAKTIATVIDELRAQAKDQLEIAARFLIDPEAEARDMIDAAHAAGFAQSALKSLAENMEQAAMSNATVAESPSVKLIDAALKRALAGEDSARAAILDAAAKLQPKGKTRVR